MGVQIFLVTFIQQHELHPIRSQQTRSVFFMLIHRKIFGNDLTRILRNEENLAPYFRIMIKIWLHKLGLVWKIGSTSLLSQNGHLLCQKSSANIVSPCVFSLKIAILCQKFVTSSIFKQALNFVLFYRC